MTPRPGSRRRHKHERCKVETFYRRNLAVEKFSGKGLRERAGRLSRGGPRKLRNGQVSPGYSTLWKIRYLIGQSQNHPFSKTCRWFSENLGIRPLALLREANPNTKFSLSFQLQFSIAGWTTARWRVCGKTCEGQVTVLVHRPDRPQGLGAALFEHKLNFKC